MLIRAVFLGWGIASRTCLAKLFQDILDTWLNYNSIKEVARHSEFYKFHRHAHFVVNSHAVNSLQTSRLCSLHLAWCSFDHYPTSMT